MSDKPPKPPESPEHKEIQEAMDQVQQDLEREMALYLLNPPGDMELRARLSRRADLIGLQVSSCLAHFVSKGFPPSVTIPVGDCLTSTLFERWDEDDPFTLDPFEDDPNEPE